MTTTYHEYLRQFLREWLEWVDRGCPNHPVFQIQFRLCCSFDMWLEYNEADDDNDVYGFMTSLFREEGLDEDYPFEEGVAYDRFDKTVNPTRLAWAERMAQ